MRTSSKSRHRWTSEARKLQAPEVLLRTAHGPVARSIENVLVAIGSLAPEVRAVVDRHVDPECVADLRLLSAALNEIRADELPSREQLSILARPHHLLRELAMGFADVAAEPALDGPQQDQVATQVTHPLRELETAYLPGPSADLVALWVDNLLLGSIGGEPNS